MDINELYKRACNNDISAEKHLFDFLNESFSIFIQKRVWNKEDSEEIVQEAMLTIAQKYKTAELNSDFAAWAYMVLKNKMLDYIKLKGIRTSRIKPSFDNTPEPVLFQPDLSFKMKVLDCFKKICRKNIRFARVINFHYQGFETEQICEKMNLTANSLYILLSRARSMMKHCLGDKDEQELDR